LFDPVISGLRTAGARRFGGARSVSSRHLGVACPADPRRFGGAGAKGYRRFGVGFSAGPRCLGTEGSVFEAGDRDRRFGDGLGNAAGASAKATGTRLEPRQRFRERGWSFGKGRGNEIGASATVLGTGLALRRRFRERSWRPGKGLGSEALASARVSGARLDGGSAPSRWRGLGERVAPRCRVPGGPTALRRRGCKGVLALRCWGFGGCSAFRRRGFGVRCRLASGNGLGVSALGSRVGRWSGLWRERQAASVANLDFWGSSGVGERASVLRYRDTGFGARVSGEGIRRFGVGNRIARLPTGVR
jgi:hypothetical protein